MGVTEVPDEAQLTRIVRLSLVARPECEMRYLSRKEREREEIRLIRKEKKIALTCV